MGWLEDDVAIVTGAGSGLGRALVDRFVAGGPGWSPSTAPPTGWPQSSPSTGPRRRRGR